MTIARIQATAVAIPLSVPTRISTRPLDRREFLLVEVHAEDGASGIGYSYAGTRGGRVLAAIVDDLLAEILVGTDDADIAAQWRRMYHDSLLMGRRGGVLRAMSAVDIALWDLAAKRVGVPLARLLGGSRLEVPAYASGGYYRPHPEGPAAAIAEEIAQNREEGFTDHKMKVGGLPVAEDAERVAAAVSAMPPGDRLAIDANNAYPTVYEAANALRAFEEAAGDRGLWWFEEPLTADDLPGHAQLRARSRTPIATGELHQTRWEFRDLVREEAADIVQIDVGVVGGISEWMLVAQLAQANGLHIAPHWHANVHAHLLSGVPDAICVEYFALAKDIYNFERVVTPQTRVTVRDGLVRVPDAPGIGIEFDQDAVAQFAIH